MSASLSLASTTAPHLIILSTSLVQAALLRRCCKMIRASWHSRHAVVAFAWIGPGGRSSVTFAGSAFSDNAQKDDVVAIARMASVGTTLPRKFFRVGDMSFG